MARLLSEGVHPQEETSLLSTEFPHPQEEVLLVSALFPQSQGALSLLSIAFLQGQEVLLVSIRFGFEQEQRGDAAGEMPFSLQPQPERLCQALSLQLVKFRLCQEEPWRAVQFCSVVLEEGQPPEKVLFWNAARFDAPEQQDLL